MANFFSYLDSPLDVPPQGVPHITQFDDAGATVPAPAADEGFDEAAEANDDVSNDGGLREWILPDPAQIFAGVGNETPLDRLATVAARASTPAPHGRAAGVVPTPTGAQPLGLEGAHRTGEEYTPEHAVGNRDVLTAGTSTATSALVLASRGDKSIKTSQDLIAFLEWQSSRRGDSEDQKRFREDALAFPRLLVFATMRKKSPYVHLVHSAGIYPNIPGADPAWKGKAVGFLGDKTKFALPQMIELGKSAAWGWDDPPICKDVVAMKAFYAIPENVYKFWVPPGTEPRVRTVCPRMLALPPDCVAFCAEGRRTPAQLYDHITNTLGRSGIDPRHYDMAMDWCCMATQPGTGVNSTSSVLSFAMPAIMGSTEHLYEWAHNRLGVTLHHHTTAGTTGEGQDGGSSRRPVSNNQPAVPGVGLEPTVLAQVAAAVVAAFRTGTGTDGQEAGVRHASTSVEEPKAYSEFQLAKLKGFCCIRNNSSLPPIWEYFRSTKEVDAQRTQLMEDMNTWARQNDVQLNRGVYFDKHTMDDIVKLEFCPGTPTAYWNTAEQGMSLLICRPRSGNETADIRTKEHAIKLTARNHTLTEALLLGKRDPRAPASNYHELKLDLGTFCALLWVLFGEKCDYFENCFALLRMLDSDNIFANANTFTPLMCRQITWAVINDSRQYFFKIVTADHFASGRVRWPTSLLMQIIGADIQACRGILMGNFPSKWMDSATVGSYLRPTAEKPVVGSGVAAFPVPPGVPPAMTPRWSQAQGGSTSYVPDSAASGTGGRPVSIRADDIHPTIKQMMANYVTHFRSVQLRSLLRVAKMAESDLPTLSKYMSNGKNNLCYAYVLGKCQGKMCGRAPQGHAPVGDIPDSFATDLCRRLSSAVEQRLSTEPPTAPGPYAGGHQGKRFKRTA